MNHFSEWLNGIVNFFMHVWTFKNNAYGKTDRKTDFKSENREEMPYGFYFMDFYEVHDLHLSVFVIRLMH